MVSRGKFTDRSIKYVLQPSLVVKISHYFKKMVTNHLTSNLFMSLAMCETFIFLLSFHNNKNLLTVTL